MKATGERPIEGITPDGLVALHRSSYQEAACRLGPGSVLDVGCGVGIGAAHLSADGRSVVGVDYSRDALETARTHYRQVGPGVVRTDGGRLGLRAGQFDSVVSCHLIEHFADPEDHVRELARVLAPEGVALIFTPNRPADLENPFHLHLFERDDLAALLRQHFAEVWVGGHDASEVVKDDFATRRAAARRLLRLDVWDFRHRIPRRWYVWAYSVATRVLYRIQATRHAGGVTNINEGDFFVTDEVDETTLSLFAVARRPR